MSRTPLLALIAMSCLISGCQKQYRPLPPPALGPSVLRLTQALRAELGHYPNDELVKATFRTKPELEQDFRGYTIRTRSSGTNLVVLVCTKDSKYALYEDASWTPYVDKTYEVGSRHTTTFSIDPATGPSPLGR
jgi:hypothetical protein